MRWHAHFGRRKFTYCPTDPSSARALEVETRFGIVGQLGRQIPKFIDGFVQPAVGNQCQSQIVMSPNRLRIKRERLATVAERRRIIAGFETQRCEVHAGDHIGRFKFDRPAQISFRGEISMTLELNDSKVAMDVRIRLLE